MMRFPVKKKRGAAECVRKGSQNKEKKRGAGGIRKQSKKKTEDPGKR